jgi:hypothetical protein
VTVIIKRLYYPNIFIDGPSNMSEAAGVREYGAITQIVPLRSYNASDFYWDVPGSNFGQSIDHPERGICGFAATIQANDGIDTKSVHSSFVSLPVKFKIH